MKKKKGDFITEKLLTFAYSKTIRSKEDNVWIKQRGKSARLL